MLTNCNNYLMQVVMQEILPQLIVNSLITGSIYAIAASGMAMTYGVMRILNFSHGHMMMLGAYIFFFLRYTLELNLFFCIVLNALSICAISYLANKIFIQSFLKYDNYLPLVTTLALASILESLAALIFGVDVHSLPLDKFSQSIEYGSIFITPIQITIIICSILVISKLAIAINCTSYGRKIKAVSENSYSAQSIGINTKKVTSNIFILSSVLASLAGVLVAYETNLQLTMGKLYTMKAMAAMVLGGLGNLWGTLAGAYLIAFIENFFSGADFENFSINAGYKDAFSYSVILLVLLLRPKGLFASWSRKV